MSAGSSAFSKSLPQLDNAIFIFIFTFILILILIQLQLLPDIHIISETNDIAVASRFSSQQHIN